MKCKHCGSIVPKKALFCTNCGAKVIFEKARKVNKKDKVQMDTKTKWLMFSMVFVTVAVVLFTCNYVYRNYKEQYVSSVLARADNITNVDEYNSIIREIEAGLVKYPKNTKLLTAKMRCKEAYKNISEEKSKAHSKEPGQEMGQSSLTELMDNLSGKEAEQVYQYELDMSKCVPLDSLEMYRTENSYNWEWNKGDATDINGNEYDSRINYVIPKNEDYYPSDAYVEYKLDKQYAKISFKVSPYKYCGTTDDDVISFSVHTDNRSIGQNAMYPSEECRIYEYDISDTEYVGIACSYGKNAVAIAYDFVLHEMP